MNIEERLIDIEIKLTGQDDLTQELNRVVYQQQKQIDELRLLCTALIKRLGEGGGDAGDPHPDAGSYTQEKPPHY
ncbi:SlyX protein [Pollutimonas nitritireducens]|uniref:SlyX protein n=1 Tax=Pollutimonas nitritireducens TaxID=2045209 RepID=A0A2N4UHX8_9BURK|nr:SlyX family protein [Pollutimonas nitritireducens]PLC54575.1 SlyX protein [Pollutimonas nitritireducens]